MINLRICIKNLLIGIIFLVATNNLFAQFSEEISFVENVGQLLDQNNKPNSDVNYLARKNDFQVQLRNNGFSYELIKDQKLNESQNSTEIIKTKSHFHRIDFNFIYDGHLIKKVNSSEKRGLYRYITNTNELNAQSYKGISYVDIWPGVDVDFESGNNSTNDFFKYNFKVKNHEAFEKIRFEIKGAIKHYIFRDTLFIETSNGIIKETIPYSWSNRLTKKINIRWKYFGNDFFGFELLSNNVDFPIVIDPIPNRAWGTYYGGHGDDRIKSIATDKSGNIYFGGQTSSSSAIATTGAYQTTRSSTSSTGVDAMLSKFARNGKLCWTTYYGGTQDESITKIIIDGRKSPIVVGYTSSTNFPVSSGCKQSSNAGNVDGFIIKFSDTGQRKWATYFGGTQNDNIYGVDVDQNYNIYFGGSTGSNNASIVSAGVWKPSRTSTDIEGWLGKFDSTGVFSWASFFGGTNTDVIMGVSYNKKLNKLNYCGYTQSNTSTVSTSKDKIYSTVSITGKKDFRGGASDAFVGQFSNTGALGWSRYSGDTAEDLFNSIETDTGGNIYCYGTTFSRANITTKIAHQKTYGGSGDAYLAKYKNAGDSVWISYVGGSFKDVGWDLTIDTFGYIYCSGITETDNDPTTAGDTSAIRTWNTWQDYLGGGFDAYIEKFHPSGKRIFGTYYGGSGNDGGVDAPDDMLGLAVGANNDLFLGSYTTSTRGTGWAIPSSNGYKTAKAAGYDAFLVKFFQCKKFLKVSSNSAACLKDTIKFYVKDSANNTSLKKIRYYWTGPGNYTSNIQNAFELFYYGNSTNGINRHSRDNTYLCHYVDVRQIHTIDPHGQRQCATNHFSQYAVQQQEFQ